LCGTGTLARGLPADHEKLVFCHGFQIIELCDKVLLASFELGIADLLLDRFRGQECPRHT
jgi:hypothetical protein